MERILLVLVCLASGLAGAQERDVERALLQRQQQSDEFSLQLRQSQQRLQLAPGDLNQQRALESRHFNERLQLENLGAQQQLSITGQAPAGAAYERQAAGRDRQLQLERPFVLRLPPPQVRAPVTPRPKEPEPYFPSYN
jgi:hypothetical protein